MIQITLCVTIYDRSDQELRNVRTRGTVQDVATGQRAIQRILGIADKRSQVSAVSTGPTLVDETIAASSEPTPAASDLRGLVAKGSSVEQTRVCGRSPSSRLRQRWSLARYEASVSRPVIPSPWPADDAAGGPLDGYCTCRDTSHVRASRDDPRSR
ncbi:hypothetical protein LSAT2_005798 [Lamellibrachia satsuma]|nr:hypothetical protein LSAT2_005798 [Lamellibrachia satsuma]